VTSLGGRDPQVIESGIAGWLGSRSHGHVTIRSIERPTAGYSSDITFVEVDEQRGAEVRGRSLVVRLAPDGPGTFPRFDLAAQVAAQRAAARAGVPVPSPLHFEEDPSWLGAPFVVMPRVDGHVVGDVPGHDRWIRSLSTVDQRHLHAGFLRVVAAVHSADPRAAVTEGVPARDLADDLRTWRHYLHWACDGRPPPALERALERCRDTAPGERSAQVLLWGDARLGNAVFGDDLGVRAVLDWDMASVGPAEHDVAWMTSQEQTMRLLLGTKAPGLLDRDGIATEYESITGRRLSHLDWFETFALFRSTAVVTRVARLQAAAGVPSPFPLEDNPMLDLLTERVERLRPGS
jgi:aminoglycoside phosphotransferase (APT) family kinase protein